jgi:hypothetical protein
VATPVLYHVPIQGKHILSLHFHGQRETTDTQSSNWAGYADTSDTYQAAYTSWVEPTVKCTSGSSGGLLGGLLGGSSAAYSSFWVGLDGYTSTSVEQTGTDSDCTSSGTPSYYAWYEMYPAGSVDLSTTTYPEKPGDSMTAMIMSNAADTTFALMLKNNTEHWSYTDNATSSGLARSSAEFVAEAPSSCTLLFCHELALANFGSVTFTGAGATDLKGVGGNVNTFSNAAMTMDDNSTVLATPGPLTNTAQGSSFTVNWNS